MINKKIDSQNRSRQLDKLCYKNYGFDKVSLPSIFLRDIYKNNLSIKYAGNEQSDLFKMFGNLNKGRKSSEKAREYVLNVFKSNLFPIESENTQYSTPRGWQINASELSRIFIDDIKNSAKILTMKYLENILDSPSFLVKDLLKASKSSYLFNQLIKKWYF